MNRLLTRCPANIMKRISQHAWCALIAGFLSLTLLTGPLLADDLKDRRTKLEGTTPAQWRITWTKNPQTRATISWSTKEPGNRHRVFIGTEPHGQDLERYQGKVNAQENGTYSGGADLYYHHATIKNLKPGTTYYFVLASDRSTSAMLHFITAPENPSNVKLLSGGDSRSDPSTRRKMNVAVRDLVEQYPKIVALAHGGDYVANGRDLNQFSTWMSDHELTTTSDGRVLPIIPTRGNHEASGSLYQEVFDTPGGETNYYTTLLTKEILLITLNTTISTAGNQKKFLRKTLKSSRDVHWRTAQYHRPVYPAVKGPMGNKEDWVPLFEKYGLHLALENDGHVFKRTPPILDGKPHPKGVVYMGEGGMGVPQRTPKKDRWYLQNRGTTQASHHLILLNITREKIQVRTLDQNLELIDQTVIPHH